jgi:homoserine O-acetyltransferase/O-succinyltransferase
MNQIDRCRISNAEPLVIDEPPVPCRRAGRTRRGDLPISLVLTHGGTAEVRLGYEIVGREDAPVLIVAGGISAGRHVLASDAFPDAGWWQVQADAFNGYRILAIDWIGADGLLDRPIDPIDQAAGIAALLDHRGIEAAAGFIGASYGALVGMHFAARYPGRLGGLLAISAADRAHPFASACRALQRQALRLGEENGDATGGVALARALAILTYRTPQEFAERFDGAPAVANGQVRVAAQSYLDAHGERHCRRMSAAAYRRLSESIDLHRIDPSSINIPLTLVAVGEDALVPAADIEAFADAARGTVFRLIHSRFGHDAFLKEEAQVAAIISEFLETLEIDR